MRIGLLVYGSLEIPTGGYLYDRIMAEALAGLGHTVETVSLADGPYLCRLGRNWSPALRERLFSEKFDLLLQDELCHPSLFHLNRQLKKRGGPPLVAIVHQVLCDEPRNRWRNFLYGLIEKRYLSSVDGFVFNSLTTRRTVEAMVGGERPLAIAYPAGNRFSGLPDTETTRKRARRPGPLQLLFLGNVIPRKGLLPLIEALASVDPGLWRLSVAGSEDFDHRYADRVRRLVHQLGLADAVRFFGHCRGADLHRLLAESHLFCMPYAHEGFGIAILEAMSFGLPAIGCRTGAAAETIRPGENGFLLDPEDRQGLGPLIAALYHDRPRLAKMAAAAIATFENRPRWQDGAAVIDQFLRTMMEKKS
jgi:glycosyltransferase involved in cell wall biosynthesis